jgi:hypothetical protein
MTDQIEQPKDSSNLQLMSLCAFMHQLGYFCEANKFYGPAGMGAEIIHFNTAVKLHNSTWEYANKDKAVYVPEFHRGQREKSPFVVDGYMLGKMMSSKILETVAMQSDKHGVVKVQKSWVRFTNDDTYTICKGLLV